MAPALFTESLTINPRIPDCLFGRAVARGNLRNGEGALDDISQAIALRDNPVNYQYRAMVFRNLDRTAEAQADEATFASHQQPAPHPDAAGK
jgi:hypothetical protein